HSCRAACYGKGGALRPVIRSGESVTVKEVSYNPGWRNKHGGLVVVGDYVYGDHDDSGQPFCADVNTGKVLWRRKTRGPGSGSAAGTYADGCLYFRYDNGVIALAEASSEGHKESASFTLATGSQ